MLRYPCAALCAFVAILCPGLAYAFDAELGAYIECNKASSRRVAPLDGEPASLAIAARNMCGRQASALTDAAIKSGSKSSMLFTETLKRRIIEVNLTTIVEERLRMREAR